jgi:hypothetical protein
MKMKEKRISNHFRADSTGSMAKKRATACIIVFFTALSFVHANNFDERIMGQGNLTKKNMVDFLLAKNRGLERNKRLVEELIQTYIDEAKDEGVNHDIAFAQLCYHTQYLSFAQTFVKQGTYNYCGFASLCTSNVAHRFSNREEGVRAHIQHLKGYATTEPLNKECVDPRYHLLKERNYLGSSPLLRQLSSKWSGSDYAYKIMNVLRMAYGDANPCPGTSSRQPPF